MLDTHYDDFFTEVDRLNIQIHYLVKGVDDEPTLWKIAFLSYEKILCQTRQEISVYATRFPKYVTCPECLEWLHA